MTTRSPLALADNYMTLPEYHKSLKSGGSVNPALNYTSPITKVQGRALTVGMGHPNNYTRPMTYGRGGAQEAQSQKIDVLGSLFGYDEVLELIQGLDKLMADRGVYKALFPVINSVLKELTFVIQNPEYQRYKKIYVERIPRLNMRWNKLDDKIQFIKRKPFNPNPKLRLARINKLQYAKDKIISTLKMLFMRLPRLMEYINNRNAGQLGTMESQMNTEIVQAETQADQAQGEAEWDEEDGGPPVGRSVARRPRAKKQPAPIDFMSMIPPAPAKVRGSAVLTMDGAGPIDISKQIQMILKKKS